MTRKARWSTKSTKWCCSTQISDVQDDSHITGNKPGTIPDFENSVSLLHSDQSTDISTTPDTHGVDSPVLRNERISCRQQTYADEGVDSTGFEWSNFNACSSGTSHSQWGDLSSMQSSEPGHWTLANSGGDDRFSYLSNDWNLFNAGFNSTNAVVR